LKRNVSKSIKSEEATTRGSSVDYWGKGVQKSLSTQNLCGYHQVWGKSSGQTWDRCCSILREKQEEHLGGFFWGTGEKKLRPAKGHPERPLGGCLGLV